jgi:putative flippase GtrA
MALSSRAGSTPRTPAAPLLFVLAGAIAAAVNFGTRILLSTQLAYAAAIVIAYCCGMITAFVLNRRYVFRGSVNPLHRQIVWFVLVNLLALMQTLGVSLLLADWLLPALGVRWHPRELAHAAGIVVPIFTSYLGHKHWTFR